MAVGLVASLSPRAEAASVLTPWLTANPAATDAGGLVTYTVALDVRSGPAGTVWANLTTPAATVHQQDSTLPAGCTTRPTTNGTRHYECTSLSPGNSTWTVTVQVEIGPPDGALLLARLAVNYTDNSGAKQPEVQTTATVRMALPVLQVTDTAVPNPVDPGATLAYNVTMRNTGSGAAGTVWLNVTLPLEVTFVRIRAATFPGSPPCGGGHDCTLSNVGPGATESYEIEVTVAPTTPQGTRFYSSLAIDRADADGTLLAPDTVIAPADVRVIRDLTLAKIADATVAYPEGRVTFTLWYNNTGGAALGAAWINDTLPAGLSYEASAPPAIVAGSSVRWELSNVPRGANFVTLVSVVSSAVTNGTVLTNNASADFATAAGVKGQRAVASAVVLVSTNVPRFDTFTKVASARTARAGDTVRFTLWYNNTGTNAAANVTIADTIPAGTVLTNAAPTWTSMRNGTYVWSFSGVAPGPHSLTYDLVVQDGASGTLLNFAYVNYTDPVGRSLPPIGPRSASVRIEGTGGGGGADLLAIVLVVVIVALAAAGLVAYRVVGARRKLVIDEVFLLHKDGLLIKHYTRRVRPDVDSDILSGMLIAVQNFVNESFIGSEGLQREGQLDELRFGDFKIVIERGTWVIVAAVLSGDPTNRVKDEVKAAIQDLEAALGTTLEGWTGEMKSVEGADRFIQDLIAGRYHGARGKG